MSGPSIPWSNVDYGLEDFIKKSPPPQVAKIKKDGSKSAAFKHNYELILHDSKALKKVEACVVSEGKTFVLPYDCPAKVYQLTKAEEYGTLSELRKVLPTCRFFLLTTKSKDQQLKDIEPGEVLSIIFKKTISGCDVFTCERKKLSVKIEIKGNAQGGFAPMGTTTERKISDFVRHYSTFPVGIGLTESTLANKAFGPLSDLITQSKSGLIRLTRLFTVDTVIASSLGKKKTVYAIPTELGLTVTASKAVLLEDAEHKDFCRKLHEEVDKSSIDSHLSLVVSFGNIEKEVVQWGYGDESVYDEVVPLAAGKSKDTKANGELPKRDVNVKDQVRKISSSDTAKDAPSKDKESKIKETKEKETKGKKDKETKEKTKDKEKSKDKQKDKKNKEPKVEKTKAEKSKSNEKSKAESKAPPSPQQEDPEEPVEDDSGYLVPAELLRAQKQVSQEQKGGEAKERSSIGISLGRFMDKVKGKKDGKKAERPVSCGDILDEGSEEPQKRSATMPATSNVKTAADTKNKSKTLDADQMSKDTSTDKTDGAPISPAKDKETKKGLFGTAGRKAGAKIRHKLKNKEEDNSKKAPQTSSSSLPPSPNNDEIDDQDMYVTPVDDQLTSSCTTSTILDRELPEIPPEDLRKTSTMSVPEIPYDDDDLYDEINPVAPKNFKIPKDLSKLSTNEVSDVLRSLNMGEHVAKFRNQQIDGEMFKSLDEQTLGALGVIDPVQKLKIKKLLKGWRPKK